MSKSFVKDPREVVKPGDVVRVKVLDVDIPRQRISLTLRLDDEPQRGGQGVGRQRGDQSGGQRGGRQGGDQRGDQRGGRQGGGRQGGGSGSGGSGSGGQADTALADALRRAGLL
jgi:protein Tex